MQTGNTQVKTWTEAQRFVIKQVMWCGGRECLVFTVVGYNIRVFSRKGELVSGYHIQIWGNNFSFIYDLQRHKQEVTQVKLAWLVSQNKLN